MIDSYDDIINIKHFEPKNHPRMSMDKRAAQFAPFAALTGYDDAVIETGRITDNEVFLDDDVKENISNKLNLLLKSREKANITYFVKDLKKSGGSFKTIYDSIKKIDSISRYVYFTGNERIVIDDITNISLDNEDSMLY